MITKISKNKNTSCTSGIRKYLKKGQQKYLNIFEKLKPAQTNMEIHSKDWKHYIFKAKVGTDIRIYSRPKGQKIQYMLLKITFWDKVENKQQLFANIFWS